MNKLLQITLNDLRVTFSENAVYINIIVIPIVLIIAVGIAQGGFGGGTGGTLTARLDILALEESASVEAFITGLRETSITLTLCPYDGAGACDLAEGVMWDENTLRERIADGDSQGALIIPAGFADALTTGDTTRLVYLTQADPFQPSALLQSVEAVLNRMTGASIASQVGVKVYEDAGFTFTDADDRHTFRQAIYDDARQQWADLTSIVTFIEAGSAPSANSGGGFRQSIPGMGTMYVMFTVLAGASTLLLERKHWTLQRMMMMPVTRAQFIGGKLLARFIMGMVQFAIAFATSITLGVNMGNDVIALLLIMMAFVVCIAGLTFLIATFVQTNQQAGTIITFVSLTLAPLGGAWWPLEIVPDFMQTIAYATPVGWAMDGFTQVIVYGAGVGDILLNVGVLFMAGVVLFGVAVWRFRYDTSAA